MGWRLLWRGDTNRFVECFERALRAARSVGEPVTEGMAEACLALLEVAQDRTDEALARLEASLERLVARPERG